MELYFKTTAFLIPLCENDSANSYGLTAINLTTFSIFNDNR